MKLIVFIQHGVNLMIVNLLIANLMDDCQPDDFVKLMIVNLMDDHQPDDCQPGAQPLLYLDVRRCARRRGRGSG